MSFIQLTQVQQLLAQTQINISFYSLKGHFAQHFPPDSEICISAGRWLRTHPFTLSFSSSLKWLFIIFFSVTLSDSSASNTSASLVFQRKRVTISLRQGAGGGGGGNREKTLKLVHRNKRRKKSIWGPAGWQCAHANGCLSISDNNLLVFAHTYMCLISSSSKACWRSDKRMNNAMKKMMMGVNIENSHNFSSKDLYLLVSHHTQAPSFIISPHSLRRKGSSCSKPDTPKAHTRYYDTTHKHTQLSPANLCLFFFW